MCLCGSIHRKNLFKITKQTHRKQSDYRALMNYLCNKKTLRVLTERAFNQ